MPQINIPTVSYKKTTEIIVKYLDYGYLTKLKDIADKSKINKVEYSKVNPFLEELKIVGRDRVHKKLTDLGAKLANSLKYNQEKEISLYWRKVIEENNFMVNLLNEVYELGELPKEKFQNKILSSIKLPGKSPKAFSYYQTGAKTIIDIFVIAKVVIYQNGKYVVNGNIRQPNLIESHNFELVHAPDFSKLKDDEKTIEALSRRWRECSLLIDRQTPLSAVIMMGSLLEALLYTKLSSIEDKSIIYESKHIPIDKNHEKKPMSQWTLSTYINIAHELGFISQSVKKVSTNFMEYRNLIHYREEIKGNIVINSGDERVFWNIIEDIVWQLTQ
jgi:hypothetical protein